MKQRTLVLVTCLAFLAGLVLVPVAAQAAITANASGTGTAGSLFDETFAFRGTYELRRFVAENGELFAVGPLTGTATSQTQGSQTIVQNLNIRVDLSTATATCQVLHLEIGPVGAGSRTAPAVPHAPSSAMPYSRLLLP